MSLTKKASLLQTHLRGSSILLQPLARFLRLRYVLHCCDASRGSELIQQCLSGLRTAHRISSKNTHFHRFSTAKKNRYTKTQQLWRTNTFVVKKHLITIVFSVCFCKKKASKFLHFSFIFFVFASVFYRLVNTLWPEPGAVLTKSYTKPFYNWCMYKPGACTDKELYKALLGLPQFINGAIGEYQMKTNSH